MESGVLGLEERVSHVSVLFGSKKVDRVEMVDMDSFPGWLTQEAVVSV